MREIDVQALQEEMQVGYWELVNGEDTVYRDSRGNVYDSWDAWKDSVNWR